jgi:D-alanine transaminase
MTNDGSFGDYSSPEERLVLSRIAYVNGRYVPHRHARVHIEDRGFQFADAVYEVIAIRRGAFIDAERHLARLARSRAALKLAAPMSDAALSLVLRETARRNGVADGIVYLQVSRGTAPRDFAFPAKARPSLVVTARRQRIADPRLVERGVAVITVPDLRWRRPDIKSVSLLPNAMAKQQAKEAGAYEAWQIDEAGNVTEGTSSNAWIVTAAGEVVTRRADGVILAGVTRLGVFDILARDGLRLAERPFSVAEAKAAREAMLTSATNGVLPVVRIDGAPVGEGRPGPVALKLAAAYRAFMDGGGQ